MTSSNKSPPSTSTSQLSYEHGTDSEKFRDPPVQSCNRDGLPGVMVGPGKAIQNEVPVFDATNFATKLMNVRSWWNLGIALLVVWNKLDEIERVYTTLQDRLKAIFNYFKNMHPYPKWRAVIWGLDESGDTQVADKIRNFAEPVKDKSLTVENIVGVLNLMKSSWYSKLSHILAVPPLKKSEIKQRSISEEEKLKEFVQYVRAYHPRMSWDMLAGALHSMEEHEALQYLRAKKYLIPKNDPLLTFENVRGAIKEIKNWHRFGWWLDVPLSRRDEIKKDIPTLEKQIDALVHEWLEHHPCPSWRLLAWALLRRRELPEHHMLKRLYGTYIPENHMSAESLQLKSFVKRVVKKSGSKIIGKGAYGFVEIVTWHGVDYAAKDLKAGICADEKTKFYERFRKEYELLTELRHKNIVEYHGLCFLPRSERPLLMMELLKIDLHKRIMDINSKDYHGPLMLREKVSILHDVAEGLDYLHTHKPPVIHRDLSAANVLLDDNNVAKICDFGNSRILEINESSCIASRTCTMGTLDYAAPETLNTCSPQEYGAKIDIFSFGHLALFVMTDIFPGDLYPAVRVKLDGTKESRTEVERRSEYIKELQSQSEMNRIPALVSKLVVQCLDNRPQLRPTAKELVTSFKCLLYSL